MADPTRIVIGEYTSEERRRLDHLVVAATAVAGRTDIDSGWLTRMADKLEKYTATGVPIPK